MKIGMLRVLIYIIILIILTACVESEVYAPVTDVETIEPLPQFGIHYVKSGETLYSIAWRYGLDYRSLVRRNHLISPYTIHTGQAIYLKGWAPPWSSNESRLATKYTTIHQEIIKRHVEKEPMGLVTRWTWPANGYVVGVFSDMNKGVNISGHLGDPIYASASGKVVYSGNGLRGYGNLIIIKHNGAYLTAYAHNRAVFVKTGDWVNSGQMIAEMGRAGAQRAMLHFEIRFNGRPMNPLIYLSK